MSNALMYLNVPLVQKWCQNTFNPMENGHWQKTKGTLQKPCAN